MRGILLFDIDGVIRDVSESYRLAIQETVQHFTGWRPEMSNIDSLKSEGCWNNDWDASLGLIQLFKKTKNNSIKIPKRHELITIFNEFYFGGNPEGDPSSWKGFIQNEKLLIDKDFFKNLTLQDFKWGFFSGAEAASAKYILTNRLELENPKLIAMGEVPGKPNPTGLIKLASSLVGSELGEGVPCISYLGDTVADVQTIKNARDKLPKQRFKSIGVAPPHLHLENKKVSRLNYENQLKNAGVDTIIQNTNHILEDLRLWE